MPSMRVLLVHLFPRLFGTTQNSTNKYYVNNSSNRTGAGPTRSLSASQLEQSGINYSKSYTVQHGNQWENDETYLVPMGDLTPARLGGKVTITET
jgi:hypothetical protein